MSSPLDDRSRVRLARAYAIFGGIFLLFGGLLALVLRWQLAAPGKSVPFVGRLLFPGSGGAVTPSAYTSLFTLHGTVMIFFAITPLLVSCLAVLTLPRLLGVSTTAFPGLTRASFPVLALGGLVLLASIFVPGGTAGAGWTAYPPLATKLGAPLAGQSFWIVAVLLAALSSLCVALDVVATTLAARRFGDMCLTAWGIFLSSLLTVLFVPVVATGLGMLFADRTLGTRFFVGDGSDPILYQHLFWIFGHPEVYVLILPGWGLVSDLLSVASGRPPVARKLAVISLVLITFLSTLVYGHHMYVVGLSPLLTKAFMVLTLLISVPSAALVVTWLLTLATGRFELSPASGNALAMVLVFVAGGLTGLPLGAITTDVYLHDSYYVVGHFHLTMAAAVLFASFAALHHFAPALLGRPLSRKLAYVHTGVTLLLVLAVFGGMLLAGWAGMQRRLYSTSEFAYLAGLARLIKSITHAAILLGLTQLLLVADVGFAFFRKRSRDEDAPFAALRETVPERRA